MSINKYPATGTLAIYEQIIMQLKNAIVTGETEIRRGTSFNKGVGSRPASKCDNNQEGL